MSDIVNLSDVTRYVQSDNWKGDVLCHMISRTPEAEALNVRQKFYDQAFKDPVDLLLIKEMLEDFLAGVEKLKQCPYLGCSNYLNIEPARNPVSRRNSAYICEHHGNMEAWEDWEKRQ